ncbi:MAG: hypothetical protein AAFY81_12090 [Pseudomonadota bacterium]
MLKPAIFVSLAAAVNSPSGAAEALKSEEPTAEQIAVATQTAVAAVYCLAAVGKDGPDPARFDEDAAWTGTVTKGYSQGDMPIAVSFPKDKDGVSRTCVVEATLASLELQYAMRGGLEAALQSEPIDQGSNLIWMFGAGGESPRGLQFFPDYLGLNNKVNLRLVAAAF